MFRIFYRKCVCLVISQLYMIPALGFQAQESCHIYGLSHLSKLTLILNFSVHNFSKFAKNNIYRNMFNVFDFSLDSNK